jgi:hypothetical protein
MKTKTTRSSTTATTTTTGHRKRIVVVKLGPLLSFWILVVVVFGFVVVAMVWWRCSSNNEMPRTLQAWQANNNHDTSMVMVGKDCPASKNIEAGEKEEEEEQEDRWSFKTSTSMKQRLRSLLHDAVLMNQYMDQVVTTTQFSKRRRTRRRNASTTGDTGATQSEPKTTTSSITTPDDDEEEEGEDVTRKSKNKNEEENTTFDNHSPSPSPAPLALVEIDEMINDEQAAAKAMLSQRLDEFDRRVRLAVPDIDHRPVPWGGTLRWYGRDLLEKYYRAGMDLRGGEKMSASTTMDNSNNSNNNNGTDFWWANYVPFPRTKCLHNNKRHGRNNNVDVSTTSSGSPATSSGGNGGGNCRIEESILYTLQWREIYQPWKFTSSMRRQNQGGFIYAHGKTATRSLSPEGQLQHHGIVWYRPSRLNPHHTRGGRSHAAAIDPVSYFRCVFHGIERAIAPTGTFVAVVDAADFGWHHVPYPWHYWARQTINMLKDHYPHRLGYVVLINMSPMTELVLQLVRPWLPSRVRGLLRFCKSQGELAAILGQEALDEDNRFVFRTEHYYEPTALHMSDAEGEEYLKFIEPQAT